MAKSSRPRILIVGDAFIPTGYSRVIRSIFEPLSNKYDILQLAVRYQNEPHDYPWRLKAANENGDPYGFDLLGQMALEFRPDIVFMIYDVNYQGRYLTELRASGASPMVVCYSPVESGPLAPDLIERVGTVARYVVFTEFAKREVCKTVDSIRQVKPGFKFPVVNVIPHGVDTETFYPLQGAGEGTAALSGRDRARKALGLDEEVEEGAFIVLNANRNMPKKRLDITLQGFAQFARDKPPNVKLYLHTAVQYTGWNVIVLAERYGIADRLILTTGDDSHPAVTSEFLNLIYNACDVGLNTSTNEGWGLVSFEHAATGRPQLVPNHSCLTELWDSAAVMLDPFYTQTNIGDHCHGFVIRPETVAAALDRIYGTPALREQIGQAGFRRATQPEYLWRNISAKWDQLFSELISQNE